MKVLFLDIDGVLNSEEDYREYSLKNGRPAPIEFYTDAKARMISDICTRTGANIVLSSTWRKGLTLEKGAILFERLGLPAVLVGFTPDFSSEGSPPRGQEIKYFVENHTLPEEIEKFAVIDDDSDAGQSLPSGGKFFQTTFGKGITEEIKNQIIEYLEEK